jgi:hypothetical protein
MARLEFTLSILTKHKQKQKQKLRNLPIEGISAGLPQKANKAPGKSARPYRADLPRIPQLKS